ncbi:MAG: sigma-54-dependent Fis family transcriptional regulator [Rhodospirillales bacterium]|nr:MAG: sigma-54-dependent Fis family transcriptional regulator [Rhodospirillales bacterium]
MAHEIVICDDEPDIRAQVAGILEDAGYQARQASNSTEVLDAMASRQPALVILDVWLGDSEKDGLECLEEIRRDYPDQQVVMISGHATFDMAVSATKMGAYDFITKPFKTDVLIHTVERALRELRLQEENRELRQRAGQDTDDIIGTSPIMVRLRRTVDQIGRTDSRALIAGPAGAGKSLIARAIHNASPRARGRLVVLNCATLDPDQNDVVLFGMEPRAGKPRRLGVFERAHGGTLVLEEVAALSRQVQAKIVGLLHDNTFRRLGGGRPIEVDTRVLATTTIDLKAEVDAQRFNEDLYYRLNVVPIEVPPLRVRRRDIPGLVRYLLVRIAADKDQIPPVFESQAFDALAAYDWPGNMWELTNVIERLLLTARGANDSPIKAASVAAAIGEGSRSATRWDHDLEVLNQPLREAREAFEREYMQFHLTRFGGNISRTAAFVGMDRAALHRKLKSLGVTTAEKPEGAGA